MGRWCQERLSLIGGTPLCKLGEGDDDIDIIADFERWQEEELWPALGAGEGAGVVAAATEFEPSFEAVLAPGGGGGGGGRVTRRSAAAGKEGAASPMAFLSRAFPKHNLLECELAISRELTTSSSNLDAGSVVHLEFKCEATAADGSRQTLKCAAATAT